MRNLRFKNGKIIPAKEEVAAVTRNTARILASVKMLEINVSDLIELD